MFTFICKCRNTKQLLLYNITDDSGDDSDIVQGVTSALPKLVKLRWLDIWGVYLGECGKSLLDNINSPDLRVLSLMNNHLGGKGGALTSCLSRLPLLSYLNLYNSGLSKVELIQVIQVLPSSCSKLLFLDIEGASFSNVELEPVFLLNHIRKLGFLASSSEDVTQALQRVSKTLEMLHLRGNVSVSYRLHEFISAIRSLPRLRFLVTDRGILDSEGEQKVIDVLKQTGGRFVNSDSDPQGWQDYKAQLSSLEHECFNAT